MQKEIKFNSPVDLNVLYMVFHMFKYGVNDTDKKLEIICSPIFRNIFNDIRKTHIDIEPEMRRVLKIPNDIEYIEDNPFEYSVMKEYFLECKAMIDDWEGMSWNTLKKDKQEMFVINLASPFSIREETVEIFLAE